MDYWSKGMYSKRFVAGWSEMDFNGHMKNTASWTRLRTYG